MMQNGLDLKDAVEAAFGPGAFDMIAELEAEDAALEDLQSADQRDVQLSAAGPTSSVNPPRLEQQTLFLFEVAGTRFGVPLANVIEIQREPAVTRFKRGPDWFLGSLATASRPESVLGRRLK